MRKSLALSLLATMLIFSLAGCRTRTAPEIPDSQLAGVYVAGDIDGGKGYLRPYLEIVPEEKRLTVEEDRRIWSSPYREDGDRLIIENAPPDFPGELFVVGQGEGASPVLQARKKRLFSRPTTDYIRREHFPRQVGKPVPGWTEIRFGREVELSAAEKNLLEEAKKSLVFRLDFEFGGIGLRPGAKDVERLIDVSGKVVYVDPDPAHPDGVLGHIVIHGPMKISDGAGVVRFLPVKK